MSEHHPEPRELPFRSHTALLLSTALPFLQPACRHPVELAMKFLEFSETLRFYQEFHLKPSGNSFPFPEPAKREPGVFGLIDTFVLDLEGLLNGLSKVCTGDEKEIVGMFLNLIRAKKFYENYKDLLSPELLSTFFGGNGFPSDVAGETAHTGAPVTAPADSFSSSNAYMQSLTSLLNDEQRETLDLLKTLFTSDTEQPEQNS